jgi:transposase-like protein
MQKENEQQPEQQTFVLGSFDREVSTLYSFGVTLSDISGHFKKKYGMEVGRQEIKKVTDQVSEEIITWSGRRLKPLYVTMWIDKMEYHTANEQAPEDIHYLYSIWGCDPSGKKDLLGLYIDGDNKNRFWNGVLTDLQNRGIEDVLLLITTAGELTDLEQAMKRSFHETGILICIADFTRNVLQQVQKDDTKKVLEDVKLLFKSKDKTAGERLLALMEQNWGAQYPGMIRLWKNNWYKIEPYYKFERLIRKLIYTTNLQEKPHDQIRDAKERLGKICNNDTAFLRLIYQATQLALQDKSVQPVPDWEMVSEELSVAFGSRWRTA